MIAKADYGEGTMTTKTTKTKAAGKTVAKSGRGGARPGAGRPSVAGTTGTGPSTLVAARLTSDQLATAKRLGDGNPGKGIRIALDVVDSRLKLPRG
jgi:hypothetical protein